MRRNASFSPFVSMGLAAAFCGVLAFTNVAEAGRIAGRILRASDGAPTSARVFLEAGREAPLIEAAAGTDGKFEFGDVAPGLCGVFAVADGTAFGGASLTLAAGADTQNVDLRLAAPQTLQGKVVNEKSQAIAGARVPRVALLGEAKVSLPLDKLATLGFSSPTTGADGAFAIERLPAGATVALIVAHPAYAQEGVPGCVVGATPINVALSPGVEVSGEVRLRGAETPVADALVLLKNAQPPHDTVEARSQGDGAFALRLKPGAYMAQALGTRFRSAGWQQLTLQDKAPAQRVTLYVSGVGKVRGKICDAASGAPVPDCKVTLTAQGNAVAIAPAGADGAYELETAEGDNVVAVEVPAEYATPQRNAIQVTVKAGETAEIPTFWLTKIPTFRVQVIDENSAPVSGVVISLLRPAQFGWRVTDAQGEVALSFAAPPAETIIGLAEDPAHPRGALFALNPNDSAPTKAQLMPWGVVKGKVVNGKGEPLSGAVVTGQLALPNEPDGVTVWRTTSGADGAFTWESAAPGAPTLVLAASAAATGLSERLEVKPNAETDAGTISMTGVAASKESWAGKPLAWSSGRLLSGPSADVRKGRAAIVMYAQPAEALMIAEGLAAACKAAKLDDVSTAVLTTGAYPGNAPLTVLEGRAPGAATTYVLDGEGRVALETFGLPPLRVLARARGLK